MNKMFKKLAAAGAVFGITASMVLGGCGKQDTQNQTQLDPDGKSYVADFYDVKGLSGKNGYLTFMVDHEDKIFGECYELEDEEGSGILVGYNKADMSKDVTVDYVKDFEANVDVNGIIEGDISKLNTSLSLVNIEFQEDKIRLFANWYAYDESAYENLPDDPDEVDIDEIESYSKLFAIDYSLNYEFISMQEVKTDFADDEGMYFSRIMTGKDGNYYFQGNHNVYVTDSSFNPIQTVKVTNNWCENMFCTGNGDIYVVYYNDDWMSEIAKVSAASNTVGDKLELENAMRGYCASATDENILYYSGYETLNSYDISKKETTPLFKWLDVDINGESTTDIISCEDGSFFVCCHDWNTNTSQIAKIYQVSNSEITVKTEIKIASLYDYDSALDTAIVAFNKSQDKYHVSLECYYDWEKDGDTVDDAIANLNNAIMGSSAPDIVCLEGLDVRNLVKKNMLEDLKGSISNSSVINLNDYDERVINAFTYDGKLVSLPKSFNLMTIIVNSSAFSDGKNGWTMEEMLDYIAANPGSELEAYMLRSDFIESYVGNSLDEYINWDNGTVNFDIPSFRRAMEYAATLPEDFDWANVDPNFNFSEALSQGKVLSQRMYLSETSDIQMIDAYFKEGATYIGFPNPEGKNRQIITTDTSYAILAGSANKEGAWEFLEFYITQERSEWDYSFPSNKNELQAMFDKELEHGGEPNGSVMMDETGWEYEFHYSTQEEIDKVIELIDNSVAINVDTGVMDIINEEAGGYFSGQKSLDEVIGLIQSRIQIYVSERM